MMHPLPPRLLLFLCVLLATVAATPVQAQGGAQPPAQVPASYEVLGVSVEGVTDESARQFVLQSSGLRVGQQVTLPGDQAISDAIRRLYELGNFTDIDVLADRFVGNGVFLTIEVEEVPRLSELSFEGIKGGDRDELRKQVPLLRGRALRPADI